jgi:hypothetical protein
MEEDEKMNESMDDMDKKDMGEDMKSEDMDGSGDMSESGEDMDKSEDEDMDDSDSDEDSE